MHAVGVDRRRSWSIPCLLALAAPCGASELRVDVHRVERREAAVEVELDVAWRHAWRAPRNHDAAWIVLRAGGAPLALAAEGHRVVTGELPARIVPSADGVGCFVSVGAEHRGDVSWRLALRLASTEVPGDVAVRGLEMVLIPDGPFELGDDDPGAVAQASFHALDGDGRPAGPYRVESEEAIEVGRAPGALAYEPGTAPQYRGDGLGPIPAAFPKGTRAFYVMKSELTQGAYADFLNALPEAARRRRATLAGDAEGAETSSIHLEGQAFVADAPRRPANFVTWDDTAAFADWFGLRPLTELEWEKAARGPRRPCPLDFPWGTDRRDALERIVLPTRDLASSAAEDEHLLDDAVRARLGASFYGVLDLSGSLWERVVSAGDPRGRAYRGSHGDGRLDDAGDATNEDWPRGVGDGREAPGIGYRGGAEYFGGEPTLTNPESRVGVRTYAAWNGAYVYRTYSARACRTAPPGS